MSAGNRRSVVVTVGTDHHPFDRLVSWVDAWAASNPDVAVLVQRGESAAPTHAESVVMLGHDHLMAAMAAADAVVAQGGPGGIMDARSVGHRPIVVARRGSLGEHVDDHQVTFAAWMAQRDLVWVAADQAELGRLLDQATADPGTLRIPPDLAMVDETVATFAAVVEPLLHRHRNRRARRSARRPR